MGQQMSLETNRLLNLETINCKGDFLSSFVEEFQDACYVRDAYTRKHLLANYHTAKWNGLESIDDMIGITPYELWVEDVIHRRDKLNLDSVVISNEQNNLKKIHKLEDQLLFSKYHVNTNMININFNGCIRFEKLYKFPILDRNNIKVIAFITVFYNLTHQLHTLKLFQIYQSLYNKKKSIQKILQHLNLDTYFNPLELPTCAELQVLFGMHDDSRHKVVAKKLECSVPTVSNHISHIEDKLLSPFTIHDALSKLRSMSVNQEKYIDFI